MQNVKQRGMHVAVGVFLACLLFSGAIFISYMNRDARQLVLDGELAIKGQQVSTEYGCIACHTVDGSEGVGPSWAGMFGKTEILDDGTQVLVNEAYFRESIINPSAKLVADYPNVMLRYYLDEEELAALVEFARQLADQ